MISSLILSMLLYVFGAACETTDTPDSPNPPELPVVQDPEAKSFLALGDSYTIGESVDIPLRWPVQLADSLTKSGMEVASPRIIAKTGWTTGELLQAIERAEGLDTSYDLVSLLIGVNNQYRNFDPEIYKAEFPLLLSKAIGYAGGDTAKVFVLSIPDYGVTPFGQGNAARIAAELDAYNAFAKQTCEESGIQFFDITPISREAKDKPELIATDRLHPSGLMYKRWVELIFEEVKLLLAE